MRSGRFLAQLALAVAVTAGGSAVAQDPVELYRRVLPLEVTTGVISIGETVSRQLDVPERCDDGSMTCVTTRRFGRIWRIEFEAETRSIVDGVVHVDREARGTAYVALAAGREDERSYDEYLREQLARLGAAAFDERFAGLRPDREPFAMQVATRSVEPSWSCFEAVDWKGATRYSRQVTVGPDGAEQVSGTSTSGYRDAAITGPVCRALDEATSDAHPELLRTMSTPRALVEDLLRVDVSDLLLPQAYPDELAALPDGAWLKRRTVPGVERSEGTSSRNGIVESRLTLAENEISARVEPAVLAVSGARDNAWHARFTVETVERHLGPLPEARLLDSWSITATLMPTLPPRDLDVADGTDGEPAIPGDPFPVRLDAEALFRSVGASLDFHAEMSPEVLADVLVRKIAGLETEGWMLVLCRPDAPASWGLAPTVGRARLLNGDDFCGTVESLLP